MLHTFLPGQRAVKRVCVQKGVCDLVRHEKLSFHALSMCVLYITWMLCMLCLLYSYEKSNTHRFEVPRMLFDDPEQLGRYIVNSNDASVCFAFSSLGIPVYKCSVIIYIEQKIGEVH